MATKTTREACRFFLENAGYVVGRRAEGALRLARMEALLQDAQAEDVATIEWMDDDEPYDTDVFTPEEVAAKFESNEWTGPYGCVLRVGGSVEASLWGIVVGQANLRDPYIRVVEAELASECEDELRAALARAHPVFIRTVSVTLDTPDEAPTTLHGLANLMLECEDETI